MKYNTWYKEGKIGPNVYKTAPRYVYWPIDVNVITSNTIGCHKPEQRLPGRGTQ